MAINDNKTRKLKYKYITHKKKEIKVNLRGPGFVSLRLERFFECLQRHDVNIHEGALCTSE